MINININNKEYQCLIDTGARYSTLNSPLPTSLGTVPVVGFSGKTEEWPLSEPVLCEWNGLKFYHEFLLAPRCPVNLVARDILCSLNVSLLLAPDYVDIKFPDGRIYRCATPKNALYQLTQTVVEGQAVEDPPDAEIWWGLVTDSENTLLSDTAVKWSRWFDVMHTYRDPVDPMHCTFNYSLEGNDDYDVLWSGLEKHCQETDDCPVVRTGHIYVAKEGVAAEVVLPEELEVLYNLHDTAAPHITLKVAMEGDARNLGPMVKRCREARDWVPTQSSALHYSHSLGVYRIVQTSDVSLLPEKRCLPRSHGRENADHPDTDAMLASLPESMWSQGTTDVGHLDVEPIKVRLKPGVRPIYKTQYPLRSDQIDGIKNTIRGLKSAGVLIPTKSAWNTPINPVPKPGKTDYRMVHDLRKINSVVIPISYDTPNPYVMLNTITPEHKYFSCIDLANAFFCVPLHPESRDLFAFTYDGQQMTYSVLPMGFIDSPSIFNHVLRQQLLKLRLPDDVLILQYVDDLLITAKTESGIMSATKSVLQFLADTGFKVSKSKLQIGRQRVTFLGRVVTAAGLEITDAQKSDIGKYSQPKTVRDMMKFLGLINYSKNFIPSFSDVVAPLRSLITKAGYKNYTAPLCWDVTAEQAFIGIKQAMASACTLHAPDYGVPFHLDVDERNGFVNAVLYQKNEEGSTDRKVLMYYSAKLDPIEMGHPSCVRHVAAIARAIQKTAYITMSSETIVHTNHAVKAFLDSHAFTLSARRVQMLQDLLNKPHIHFTNAGVNMASQMDTVQDHDCVLETDKQMQLHENLEKVELPNATMVLFCDGHSHHSNMGSLIASYAVVEQTGDGLVTRKAEIIPQPASAQLAELRALIEACRLAKGEIVNIYTDSAYGVQAVHVDLCHWKRRGFSTSSGAPLKHLQQLLELHDALLEPSRVAIIKCKGHQKSETDISRGNDAADLAAKEVAGYSPVRQLQQVENDDPTDDLQHHFSLDQVRQLQSEAAPTEKQCWIDRGACVDHTGLYRGPGGKLVVPAGLLNSLCEEAHYRGHCSTAKVVTLISQHWWHPRLQDIAAYFVQTCDVCQKYNPRRTLKTGIGAFPVPMGPWREIVIDFTDMGSDKRVAGKRYMLVCVDTFTRWVECVAVRSESGKEVIKWLTQEIIPRFGVPRVIRSDNGTHFSNDDLRTVERMFGIKHRFSAVYHPASAGLCERMNRTIKDGLARICAGTTLNWVDALPIVLFTIRSSPNSTFSVSPHELLMGRKMPCPFTTELSDTPPRFVRCGDVETYLKELRRTITSMSQQIAAILSKDDLDKQPPVEVGSWVLHKIQKFHWHQPRYKGPFQVEQTTEFCVKVRLAQDKVSNWLHKTQCVPVAAPGERTLRQVREDLINLDSVSDDDNDE